MADGPDLSSGFLKAAGGLLIVAGIGLFATSAFAAVSSASAASSLIGDSLLSLGAGAGGYALIKAPDYASAA